MSGAQRGVSLAVDDRVATITIDRVHARNAIGTGTIPEFASAVASVAELDVGVVAVRGAGDRAFVSGADLKQTAQLRTREQARELSQSMRRALDALAQLPMPVVALLNGHAIGGGAELAVTCDFRIAAADARIGFTQALLAIMPAWGGVERLVDLVGRSRAMLLLTTGRVLTASEAEDFGLVDEIVDRADFESATGRILREIARLPPALARNLKAAVDAVRPNTHPQLERWAVDAFADTWLAHPHWDALEARGLTSGDRRSASAGPRG